jgi:hypothetical protein
VGVAGAGRERAHVVLPEGVRRVAPAGRRPATGSKVQVSVLNATGRSSIDMIAGGHASVSVMSSGSPNVAGGAAKRIQPPRSGSAAPLSGGDPVA